MRSLLSFRAILVVLTLPAVIVTQERQSIVPILEKTIETAGVEAAVNTYYELKTNNESEYSFDEDEFEALGFKLLDAVRLNEAIEIFKLYVDAHPTSWRAHQALGEAYQVRGGFFQEAMSSFSKALELHPGDPQGTMALKRMKGLGDCMRAETKDTVRFSPGENGPEIWTVVRSKNRWKKPEYHCQGMFATASTNGNFYVTGFPDGDGGSLFYAPWVNGRCAEPELLSANINTPYAEMHPSVAPDESYLIFDSTRPGGEGWADFYVSFRRADGTWSEAVRIDGMSTAGNDIIPTLSPDGKYIFFTINMDIYWVDARIIEDLRPEAFR